MLFKEKVHLKCQQQLYEKIKFLQKTLGDLRDSAANETKSTAGDKHETALAMLQIEQENTARQLRELLLQKLVIDKINPAVSPIAITPGSLVTTDKGTFYVSISLGKILVESLPIVAISAQSPLGAKMLGAKQNEKISLNGNLYVIRAIE
jgi:transcription elongation GreA/GreB family factor